MSRIFGYCRISTPKQNLERQVRNILKEYPDAIIVQETFSGTKYQVRRELEKLICNIKLHGCCLHLEVCVNDFLVFLIGHSFPYESKKHRVKVKVLDLNKNFDMLQLVLVRIDSNCCLSFM